MKQAVEIQDIQILGEPAKGNTFEVLIRYKSNITNPGQISVKAADHIKFSGRSLQQNVLNVNQHFTKGGVRTERFRLVAGKTGSAYIHVAVSVPDAPAGYQKVAKRAVLIQSKAETAAVFDPRRPGDRQPKEIGKAVHIPYGETGDPKNKGFQVQSTQTYYVSVSGKIRFYQADEALFRGVYGNGVALWFRNSSDPATGTTRLPAT